MKYLYLLINIFVIFFPFVLSFDKKVHFAKHWKAIWTAIGITALFFIFWDALFTQMGVWSFNPNYLLGLSFWALPLEEILFFFTVPYACMFIYACLNAYFPNNHLQQYSLALSNLLMGLCVACMFFGYQHFYTLICAAILLVFIFYVEYVNQQLRFMYRFYRTFLVSLIPFFLVNGILTSMPVVRYNEAEFLGLRVGSIPFEDHLYLMAMLLMNIYLYEYFKQRFKA